MFYFDDYYIANFDDYAIDELTKIVEKLYHIAREYRFGTREFSFFMGLGDLIEKPLRIRKDNKMIEEKGKSILELLKVNTLDGDFKTDKIDAEKIRCHGVDEEERNKEMNFEELRENVEEWANDKDLLHSENADKQFMKFIEEVFEFKAEMDIWKLYKKFKHDENIEQDFSIEEVERWKNLKLEMGDIFVTLIILCNQLGIDCVECLQLAYEKISKRHGRTIDGIFVKEEDLND